MPRHWLVTLQKISSSGRSWDADVTQDLLQDDSCGTVDIVSGMIADAHWCVSLQRNGDTFHLLGKWETELERRCSRCNADFHWPVRGQTERFYQFGSDKLSRQEEDEDASAYEYIDKPGSINLIDVLREDVWLAWKADVVCSDSCKGLCQGCGVNLNVDPCQCKQDDSNSPFAALRSLKLDH